MEHNNATTTSTTNLRQQQQSRDQSQLSQKLQDQQQPQQSQQQQPANNTTNEHQQQFCLRWHNHQTSLLSTLPILLDQSHLTDVTISAEGRTLRAHRVVLSACSTFFLEIFRTLESTHHPVIIIPGASFSAIVALLTFMYSGEVNVYEEQIPMLLSLAETLGIKGLADVHNNKSSKITNEKEQQDCKEPEKSPTPPSPQPAATGNFSIPHTPTHPPALNTNLSSSTYNPLLNPVLNSKFPSPLEHFFLKSLQFYPNLMHQPLNFSQTALNKTSELLAKYQQQCNLYQANLGMNPKDLMPMLQHTTEEDVHTNKRFCTGLEKKSASLSSSSQQTQQQTNQMNLQQQKDIKRIDKIVENLRGVGGVAGTVGSTGKQQNHENNANSSIPTHLPHQLSPLTIKMENYTSNPSPLLTPKSSIFSSPTTTETSAQMHSQLGYNISAEDQLKLQQHLDKYAASCARTMEVANENLKNEASRMLTGEKLTTPQSPQGKAPSNSKLYATCFICHKQLSNQYNLRVHLETHQNVRYACNVCSHVSRSKDALRKHVSYRHPGAPSPCETEARRKRANKVLASQLNAAANLTANSPSSGEITPTSPNTMPHFQGSSTTAGNELSCSETPTLTAAQLSSAYQMFMPNQFHLAAAAAQQQHQQQQQQQQQLAEQQQQQQIPCSTTTPQNKEYPNIITSATATTIMNTTTNTSSMSETTKTSLNNTSSPPTPTNAPEYQNSTNNNNNTVESKISPTINP